METIPNPIKRSPQLAPLSREHHEGLLFVWKIRQGKKYGIAIDRIMNYCTWFWNIHLQDHFKKEEHNFLKILPASDILLSKMVDDHKAIKLKLTGLSENTTEDELELLAEMINSHIRFEERQLFFHIEQIANPSQLEILAKYLDHHPKNREVWPDEFWIKKNSNKAAVEI